MHDEAVTDLDDEILQMTGARSDEHVGLKANVLKR